MARLRRLHDEESLDLEAVRRDVEGWWGIKYQTKLLTQKLEEGKKALLALAQRYGETDPETGSQFLDLDEPISDRRITKLKAQRTVRRGLHPDAEKMLRELGIWDDVVEWVPQLDEGKVHAAYYDKKITDEDLKKLFPQSIHYSLILLDDAEKPVN